MLSVKGQPYFTGARVQELGYMMESDRPIRTGERVQGSTDVSEPSPISSASELRILLPCI